MDDIAFDCVLSGPNEKGQHWRLVMASSTGGWSPLKETGEEGDPFYVAKMPIWYDTREAGMAMARDLNQRELGLSPVEAGIIILKAIRPSFRTAGVRS